MHIRLKEENEPYPMALLIEADPDEKAVESYVYKSECMIAEVGDKMIGVYLLQPISGRAVELKNIAVDASERGKGYGKQLVQHAIATARSYGYKTIEVGTGNSSIKQILLYQTCGFRMDTIVRNFFVDHYTQPIYENNVKCIDMIRFKMEL